MDRLLRAGRRRRSFGPAAGVLAALPGVMLVASGADSAAARPYPVVDTGDGTVGDHVTGSIMSPVRPRSQ